MKMIQKQTQAKQKQENGILWTLTTQEVDRVGDIVISKGMITPKSNVPVLFHHGYGSNQGSVPVGKIKRNNLTIKSKSVEGMVEFDQDDFSQLIKSKVDSDTLTTGSIGFNPLETERIYDDDERFTGYKFKSWELMEFSITPTPANRSALKKELDFLTKAFETIGLKTDQSEDNIDFEHEYRELLFQILGLSGDEKSVKSAMSKLFESKTITNKQLAYDCIAGEYLRLKLNKPEFKNYTPDDLIELEDKGLIIYAPEKKSHKYDQAQSAVTIRNLCLMINKQKLTETEIKTLSDAKHALDELLFDSDEEILIELNKLYSNLRI